MIILLLSMLLGSCTPVATPEAAAADVPATAAAATAAGKRCAVFNGPLVQVPCEIARDQPVKCGEPAPRQTVELPPGWTPVAFDGSILACK